MAPPSSNRAPHPQSISSPPYLPHPPTTPPPALPRPRLPPSNPPAPAAPETWRKRGSTARCAGPTSTSARPPEKAPPDPRSAPEPIPPTSSHNGICQSHWPPHTQTTSFFSDTPPNERDSTPHRVDSSNPLSFFGRNLFSPRSPHLAKAVRGGRSAR